MCAANRPRKSYDGKAPLILLTDVTLSAPLKKTKAVLEISRTALVFPIVVPVFPIVVPVFPIVVPVFPIVVLVFPIVVPVFPIVAFVFTAGLTLISLSANECAITTKKGFRPF